MDSDTRPALVADFHRFYGLSLSDMREWGIPLSEVADMAMHLPPRESAVGRVLDPNWQRTNETDLLREIEHGIRALLWQNSGRPNSPRPERIPLPWDAKPDGTIEGDRMTLDEADEFLGWADRKKEVARGS